ncbi:hypothetical protein GW17_00061655, partial [Ensete ventricosum]
MESSRLMEFLKGKSILVTGSTGFLAKSTTPLMHAVECVLFVEKVMRVQPDVKTLFLLVRAADASSAVQRVQSE